MKRDFRAMADERLQGLVWTRAMNREVLERTRGRATMGRKLTLGAAVALMLALLSVTALAVGVTGYFRDFAAMREAYGDFGEWPDSARVALVRLMADSGLAVNAEQVAAMNAADEDEAVRMADGIIAAYYGDGAPMEIWQVMARELGAMRAWSLEDKALFSALQRQYGQEDGYRNVMPEPGDIAREEAVRLARAALDARYGLRGALDNVECYVAFASDPGTYGVEEPVWIVSFGDPDPSRWSVFPQLYRGYAAMLSQSGELMDTCEEYRPPMTEWDDPLVNPPATCVSPYFGDAAEKDVLAAARGKLRELVGEDVDGWTAEARLIWSEQINPDEAMWVVFFGGEADANGLRPVAWKALLTRQGEYLQTVQGTTAFEPIF